MNRTVSTALAVFPTLWTLGFCCPTAARGADQQPGGASAAWPNILWITCEDLSPVLGCDGDRQAATPNLDRLAAEGVRYTNAFAMASVCTPARSCLITGVYSSSLGTQHLRGAMPLPKDVKCFSEYLRRAGYYCTNNVKEDYNFATPKAAWDESSNTAHWRRRKPGQPFFSVFNIFTTHQSQIRLSDKQFAARTARLTPGQRHDPKHVELPPYYPDTPIVRRDVARLYDLVTAMDGQVQDLLNQLEEDGLADNTIVFFYSDHGTGLPRHKRWLYDSGIHVPMIVRFPEPYRHWSPAAAGTTVDRLVSFVDFAPTVLSLAGLEIPSYMQGRAFLGPADGEPRDYVFAIRDRVDECFEFSRAVRDKRYKYIRHFMPHRPIIQHSDFSERTPTRQELRRLAAAGRLTGYPAQLMRSTKDAEELFDTLADPNELNNLADSPEHRDALEQMRSRLRRWMVQTRDTGLLPEVDLRARAGGDSPYDVARRTDRFPIEPVLDAAWRVGMGREHRTGMLEGLNHADAAVRYWSLLGLRCFDEPGPSTAASIAPLAGDPSPGTAIAAAELLCALDREQEGLPVLRKYLESPDRVVRLHAAMSLVAVGPKAKPAAAAMRRAMASRGKDTYSLYTRWALAHALRQLEAE